MGLEFPRPGKGKAAREALKAAVAATMVLSAQPAKAQDSLSGVVARPYVGIVEKRPTKKKEQLQEPREQVVTEELVREPEVIPSLKALVFPSDVAEIAERMDAEKQIENNVWSLDQQLDYFRTHLGKDGYIYKEIREGSSDKRYSRILELVNTVSTRLTLAHERGDTVLARHGFEDLDSIRNATRLLQFPAPRMGDNMVSECNAFLVVDKGDVYVRTARHCVEDTSSASEYHFSPTGADVAVRYIAPSEYAMPPWNITDPTMLPKLQSSRGEDISGKIIVNYSYRGYHVEEGGKELVHVSIAMPLAPHHENDMPGGTELTAFIKPIFEAAVVQPDAPGAPGLAMSSGSSGSGIWMADGGAVIPIGELKSVHQLADPCNYICYAVTFFTDSSAAYNLIKEERKARLGRKNRNSESDSTWPPLNKDAPPEGDAPVRRMLH